MKNIKFVALSTLIFLGLTVLLSYGLNLLILKIFSLALGSPTAYDLGIGGLWFYVLAAIVAIGGCLISAIVGFFISIKLRKRWNVKWYFIPISFVIYLIILYGGLRLL